MGRDRAKEKLQAHKKVRLEKKEAKIEEREKAKEQKKLDNETPLRAKNKNNFKGRKNKDFKSTSTVTDYGEYDVEEAEGAFQSWEDNNKVSPRIEQALDVSNQKTKPQELMGEACAVNSECGVACPSTSLVGASASLVDTGKSIVKGKKDGKKSKPVTKAFTSGNPNRGPAKPVWRLIHEEATAQKEAKEKAKTRSQVKEVSLGFHGFRLEDLLKPEEFRLLRDILDVTSLDDVCPAVCAVALGRYDLIKKLMKEGQFDRRNIEGQRLTPIGCAIQTNNLEMIQFLLDKKSNSHCKDSFGNTPLIKAALCPTWTDQLMFDFWMLLKFDAETDISAANKAGVTLLHALTYRGWKVVLEDILTSDSQPRELMRIIPLIINSPMWNGSTPLMLAVDKGDAPLCELLISKGALPLAEDKAGFTPLCRAIHLLYENSPTLSFESMPPACNLLFNVMRNPDRSWDLKSYLNRRLQLIANQSLCESSFNELFYRLGRPIFVFILRCLHGGAETLLNVKFFGRLASIGLKNLSQTDFLHTLCGIFFEILVYAEDFVNLWPQFVLAFLNEGGADLCLRIIQRPVSSLGGTSSGTSCGTSDQQSSAISVSEASKLQDMTDCPESLACLEKTVPVEKNVNLSAMMSLIQLIDAKEMNDWFQNHFHIVSSCYRNLISSKSAAKFILDIQFTRPHIVRTNCKVVVFNKLTGLNHWLSPALDETAWNRKLEELTTTKLPKATKKKKNKKNRYRSEDYFTRLPPSFITPLERGPKPKVKKSQTSLSCKQQQETTLVGKVAAKVTKRVSQEALVPKESKIQKVLQPTASATLSNSHHNPSVEPKTQLESISDELKIADKTISSSISGEEILIPKSESRTKLELLANVEEHYSVSEPTLSELQKELISVEERIVKSAIVHHEVILFYHGLSKCLDFDAWKESKINWRLHWVDEDYVKKSSESDRTNMVTLIYESVLFPDDEDRVMNRTEIVDSVVQVELWKSIRNVYFQSNKHMNFTSAKVIAMKKTMLQVYELMGAILWNTGVLVKLFFVKDIYLMNYAERFIYNTVYSYPGWNGFFGEPSWSPTRCVKGEGINYDLSIFTLLPVNSILKTSNKKKIDFGDADNFFDLNLPGPLDYKSAVKRAFKEAVAIAEQHYGEPIGNMLQAPTPTANATKFAASDQPKKATKKKKKSLKDKSKILTPTVPTPSPVVKTQDFKPCVIKSSSQKCQVSKSNRNTEPKKTKSYVTILYEAVRTLLDIGDIPSRYLAFLILQLKKQALNAGMIPRMDGVFYTDLRNLWDEELWRKSKIDAVVQSTRNNLDVIDPYYIQSVDLFTVPLYRISLSFKKIPVNDVDEVATHSGILSPLLSFSTIIASYNGYDLFQATEYSEYFRHRRYQPRGAHWNWPWICQRRAIMLKRYGLSVLFRKDFVWKYVFEEFQVDKPFNILQDVNYGFGRFSHVALDITDNIHFVQFETDDKEVVSGVKFLSHDEVNAVGTLNNTSFVVDFNCVDQSEDNLYTSTIATQSLTVGLQDVHRITLTSQCDQCASDDEEDLNLKDVPTCMELRRKFSVYDQAVDFACRFIPRRKPKGLTFHTVKLPFKQKKALTLKTMKTKSGGKAESSTTLPQPELVVHREESMCEALVGFRGNAVDEAHIYKVSTICLGPSDFESKTNLPKEEVGGEGDGMKSLEQKEKKVSSRRVKLQTMKHKNKTPNGSKSKSRKKSARKAAKKCSK